MNVGLLVFAKELRDALRDRRSVLSALLYPLLSPLLLVVAFQALESRMENPPPTRLGVSGMSQAPALMEKLRDADVTLEALEEATLADAVRDGDVDVALHIPEHFEARFREGFPAPLYLYELSAGRGARRGGAKVKSVVQSWAGTVGALRLVALGVSPALMTPVQLHAVELATDKERAVEIFSALNIMVLLSCFMGGMYIAMDTTAGERERGSLEPLLLASPRRGPLVAGKLAAAVTFALFASTLTLVGCALALAQLPLEQMGLVVGFRVGDLIAAVGLIAPLTVLAAACQLLVSTFARTAKEAQTYLSLFMLLPMIPPFVAQVLELELVASNAWIPVLGQTLMLNEIIAGRGLTPWQVLMSATVALGLAAAVTWMTARLLSSEKVVFGRG